MFLKRSNIQYIVAGLGNPGRRYEQTRHNVGFWMLDALAERAGVRVSRNRFQSLCADAVISGSRVLLMKPMTFMNLSGRALAEAARFYRVDAEHILILCDDVSLAPGVVRIRSNGSSGGHNGLRSISDVLGTDDFARIRIGVGDKTHDEMDLADWVTGKPQRQDLDAILSRRDDICEAVKLIVEGRLDLAQSCYNR